MASTYTLHVAPFGRPGDPAALERAEIVRDGFSPGAFVAPMLWFFWHREWLAGLFALAAVLGLGAGLWGLGASFGAVAAAELLLHVLFGLEGASLRRFALARRGRPEADVVVASDLADAEAKSFARWLAPSGQRLVAAQATRPDLPAGSAGRAGYEPVFGLFPDLEGRR